MAQADRTSVSVYEMTEHYHRYSGVRGSAGFVSSLSAKKSAALITDDCMIAVCERDGCDNRQAMQIDVGASLGVVREKCTLLAVHSASGRFVMAAGDSKLLLGRVSNRCEPKLIDSQNLGPAIVSAYVDASKVIAMTKLGNTYTIFSASLEQSGALIKELPQESDAQSEFIRE